MTGASARLCNAPVENVVCESRCALVPHHSFRRVARAGSNARLWRPSCGQEQRQEQQVALCKLSTQKTARRVRVPKPSPARKQVVCTGTCTAKTPGHRMSDAAQMQKQTTGPGLKLSARPHIDRFTSPGPGSQGHMQCMRARASHARHPRSTSVQPRERTPHIFTVQCGVHIVYTPSQARHGPGRTLPDQSCG